VADLNGKKQGLRAGGLENGSVMNKKSLVEKG